MSENKRLSITVGIQKIMKRGHASSSPSTKHPVALRLYFQAQLSRKVIMLINVKMPTIVGILTFISTINSTSDCKKARKVFNFQYYFSFYEQLSSVEFSMKKVL